MSALTRFLVLNNLRKNVIPISNSCLVRNISTSKKNRETSVVSTEEVTATQECATKSKNWISYGFNDKDEAEDRHFTHLLMFAGISVVFVFGGFLLAYRPDFVLKDWAQREGYLELRRRERLGLPLVDPNYLPLDKIKLPTDEELGDTEIII